MVRARYWWIVLGACLILAAAAGFFWVIDDRPSSSQAGSPSPSGSLSPEPEAEPSPTLASPSAPAAPLPATSSRAAPRPPVGTSAKKGVSTWNFSDNNTALKEVGAAWYYNWSAAPAQGVTGVEFVPMIWGPASVTATNLNRAKASGKVLLGFNEPDFASQSNMSVTQALDLWPQLQATGLRLGSPAVATGGATAGGWLDRFLSGARERGLRVDFITLHWYGSDFSAAAVNHLAGYLRAVHDRYQLPIWLTEYALIKFGSGGSTYPTAAQQSAFVNGSTTMLAGLSFVERYAWFALPTPDEGGEGTGLYRKGQGLTAAGAAYRAAT